jgi:hypothetical protein
MSGLLAPVYDRTVRLTGSRDESGKVGDVVQNYQTYSLDSNLLIAIAIADVPTPTCFAISAIGILK